MKANNATALEMLLDVGLSSEFAVSLPKPRTVDLGA